MLNRFWIVGQTCVGAICLAAVFLAAGAASGTDFDPKVVSSSAEWYFHVDVDAVHASPVVLKLREPILRSERVQKHLQALKDKFHFDPTQQLHGITVYGTLDHPRQTVSVISADFEPATIADQLKAKYDFQTVKHGDHEIFTWTDKSADGDGKKDRKADDKAADDKAADEKAADDKADRKNKDRKGKKDAAGRQARGKNGPGRHPHSVALAMIGGKTAVMAHSAETVGAALDVIDGKAGALSPLAADAVAGAMVQGKAAGLKDLKLPGPGPVVSQLDRISGSISDTGGTWSANVQLSTKTAEAAGQIEAILGGLRALAQLRHGSTDEIKAALDSVELGSSNNTVTMHFEISDEDALKLHDKVHQLRKAAHERHADGKDRPARERKTKDRTRVKGAKDDSPAKDESPAKNAVPSKDESK